MAEAIAAPAAVAPAVIEAPVVAAPVPAVDAGDAKGAVRGADGKFTKPGAVKAEAPPEPRRFKVKVDGQELEVSEEDLVRDYQLKATSNKRFEETAKSKREAARATARASESQTPHR